MWSLIKVILGRFALLRGLLALLASIAAVLPIALALLKFVGWPVLVVMLVLGLPLLVVLALFGFPLIAVLTIGGVVMSMVFAVVTLGVIALKVFLFVVLPVWLLWKLASWAFRRRDGGERVPETPKSVTAAP
jgi:Zn-dependent protease with chaperone function